MITKMEFLNNTAQSIKFMFSLFENRSFKFGMKGSHSSRVPESAGGTIQMNNIESVKYFSIPALEFYFDNSDSNFYVESDFLEDNNTTWHHQTSNLETFYSHRRPRERTNFASEVVPQPSSPSQRVYFDKINAFEFITICMLSMVRQKERIKVFTQKARDYYAPDIEYNVKNDMKKAYLLVCDGFNINRSHIEGTSPAVKRNLDDLNQASERHDTLSRQLFDLGTTRDQAQLTLHQRQTTATNRARTGKYILECISDIYARGYEAAKDDNPGYAEHVRRQNQDIRAHKKEHFEQTFPTASFDYHSKTVSPELKITRYDDGKNFYPILFRTLTHLVTSRKHENRKRLFGKEKHWYTVKVGKLHRWAHDFQFGKTGEALIDIFNAKIDDLGIRTIYPNNACISSDQIREHYTTISRELHLSENTYGQTYTLLTAAREEGLRSRNAYSSKEQQITQQTNRIQEIKVVLRNNLDKLAIAIYRGYQIQEREKELRQSRQNSSELTLANIPSVVIETLATRFNIKLETTLDKNLPQIFQAILHHDREMVSNLRRFRNDTSHEYGKDVMRTVEDIIELRTLLFETYARYSKHRSNSYTYDHFSLQFMQCRETWADIESLMGLKLMNMILKMRMFNMNHDTIYEFLARDKHFFLVAYKRARVSASQRKINPNDPYDYNCMGDTAKNYLKNIKADKIKNAAEVLSTKWLKISQSKKYRKYNLGELGDLY